MAKGKLAVLCKAAVKQQPPPQASDKSKQKRQHQHNEQADGGHQPPRKRGRRGVANRQHALANPRGGAAATQADPIAPALDNGTSAYQALMGMLLTSSKGSASAALRHRYKQEQGDSDAESDSPSTEGAGSSGDDIAEHSDDDTYGIDEEQDGMLIDAGLEGLGEEEGTSEEGVGEDDGDDPQRVSDSSEEHQSDDENQHGEDDIDTAADRKAADGQHTANGVATNVATDGPAGAPKRTHRKANQQAGTRDQNHNGNNQQQQEQQQGTATVVDSWQQHFEYQLTDAEVQAMSAAARAKWSPAPARPPYADTKVFGGAQWEHAGNSALPATPPLLPAYAVKERLITRWREVHSEEAAASQAKHGQQQEAGGPMVGEEEEGRSDGHGQGKGPSRSDKGGKAAIDKAAVGQAKAGGDQPGSHSAAVGDFESTEQQAFFAALDSYTDLVVGCRPYPQQLEQQDAVQDAYLLHCLNHIAKTADRIKRNNDRLAAQRSAAQGNEAVDVPRDQGFTRPKVLILLPQRNLAFRLVLRLVKLAMRETRADSVTGKARFVEQFTDPEEVPESELDAGAAARRAAKPADWRALIGSGNTDDHFRLGIKITRGAIRLFSNLFDSDIIVASPLALATKLAEDAAKREAAEQAKSKSKAKSKVDGSQGDGAADFLSSIEVLIMDRADLMTMQNWWHVESVVAALNQLPREQHGVDIMRVREWALSGWAKHYRQTVLLSSFLTPAMNALMNGHLTSNYRGKLRVQSKPAGVLQYVIPQVQQVFERFSARSPTDAADARFAYFTSMVWPRVKDSSAWTVGGRLLFVPSYFDFVRLRNFLKAEDDDAFDAISEYTPGPDVTAARSRFFHRRTKLLLYTERAHFYHRHRIRGIKDVLFYGAPDHAHFYTDIVNLLESAGGAASGAASASGHGTVSLLYCKWDILALERLVGVNRASKMVKGDASTYMFC